MSTIRKESNTQSNTSVAWCSLAPLKHANANELVTAQPCTDELCPRLTEGERTNRMAKQVRLNQTGLTMQRPERRGLALALAYRKG